MDSKAFGCFDACNSICSRHAVCNQKLDLSTPLVVVSLTGCCPGNLIPSNVKLESSNTRIRVRYKIKALRISILIQPLLTPFEPYISYLLTVHVTITWMTILEIAAVGLKRSTVGSLSLMNLLIAQFSSFLAVQTLYLKVVSSSPESYAGYHDISSIV